MNQVLPEFDLLRPATAKDAVEMLQNNPGARLCAGGTDLIVNMRHGLVDLARLIDLSAIDGLSEISVDDAGLHIGAGVTLRALAQSDLTTGAYQAIQQAAISVAGPGHRNAGTLGGNLCLDTRCLYYNQSHWWRESNDFCLKYRGDICHVAPKGNRCRAAFSGDLAPALIVLEAAVEILGPNGARRIPLVDLYREDGADYLTLDRTEMVISVHVPPFAGLSAYGKIRIRGALDFPLAGVALACQELTESELSFRVALTGTNSCPVVVDGLAPLSAAEDHQAYFETLGKLVQKTVLPQRTTTTAAHYRRLSIAATAVRLGQELAQRQRSSG